jgi:hypothetical protein
MIYTPLHVEQQVKKMNKVELLSRAPVSPWTTFIFDSGLPTKSGAHWKEIAPSKTCPVRSLPRWDSHSLGSASEREARSKARQFAACFYNK